MSNRRSRAAACPERAKRVEGMTQLKPIKGSRRCDADSVSIERRQLVSRDQNLDRARLTRNSENQPSSLKGQNHGMHGRWRHAEKLLKVGFGWRSPVQLRVQGNVREVLSLERGKRLLIAVRSTFKHRSVVGLTIANEPRDDVLSVASAPFVGYGRSLYTVLNATFSNAPETSNTKHATNPATYHRTPMAQNATTKATTPRNMPTCRQARSTSTRRSSFANVISRCEAWLSNGPCARLEAD